MGEDVHAKNDAMFSHWLPAVNNHGGFGRWAFLVVKDIYDAKQQLDEFIAAASRAARQASLTRASDRAGNATMLYN